MGEQLQAEWELQRERGALHTSGDAWRTASVMTCFSSPLGPLFGIAGLVVLRGLAMAVNQDQREVAKRKLRHARVVVLSGAAVGALTLLLSAVAMGRFILNLPQQLEQMPHAQGLEP